MDLGISEKVAPILARVKTFIAQEIQPMEEAYAAEPKKGGH